MTDKIVIEVNSNFHRIAGSDLFIKESKLFKEYRKKWEDWPKNFNVGPFPLFIDIEVTSACNLNCPFCATTYRGKKVKRGYISFDLVKKIIDEGASSGLYGVKFNIRGEPLLHPRIYEFVEYAKKKGLIDVYFNTNAMLLNRESAQKLIDAGLDRISISFEGVTKEFYESQRKGAKYETVLSNIENLQQLKKRNNVKHPRLRIQTVLLPQIKERLEEYKEFWKTRADEVAFLDYKDMKEKRKGMNYPWACPQLWQRMAIWWDGTILPCNHDDDGLLSLGNISGVNIGDVWKSEKINKIREAHRAGAAHTIEACNGCYLRDSEINKLNAKTKKNG
ncbi:MAG: radical SAM protein [Candidatus Omnitrophica bacterium]|nr:radical SAM protein [Candidatus Omnitrophota bacterium]